MRRWLATGVGELFPLFIIAYPVVANISTSDRSHLRSSIASAVQCPLRKFPFFDRVAHPGSTREKPISEAQLIAHLSPLIAKKGDSLKGSG
jgi:hypothetical protein